MKKLKRLFALLVTSVVLVVQISANHTKYKTIETSEIRKHGEARLAPKFPRKVNSNRNNDEGLKEARQIGLEIDYEEEEPPTESLKAELRMPIATLEVIQLLGDDETRSHELVHQPIKNPANGAAAGLEMRMDCSKITMQIFQVLLQNPDSVEPEDYSCGLLNLISHFEKSHNRIRQLETSLHSATSTIKTLETSLQSEMSKTQFFVRELNETVHKESERAIKAENVIARRVLSEKARVDVMQTNITDMLTSAMNEIKEFETALKGLEREWAAVSSRPADAATVVITEQRNTGPVEEGEEERQPRPVQEPSSYATLSEDEIKKIEGKLTSLQEFIQDLANRITQMEENGGSDENVNKGITQIFKTYASLANEIEKETERATTEENNLKTLVTNEVASLTKQILSLQERITEEKNRVQIIENRRTADLFEEINRAKSEENRLGQKLKEEMSKAAAAFKRLELHVDTQMNSTKAFEEELKGLAENATRKAVETEIVLLEQISFERTRSLSVENSLKVHLETEVSRAMSAEETLKTLILEERERARKAEHELKVLTDVEAFRAKGVEHSITAQVSAEVERAKGEEDQLREHLSGNTTRILADIIQEFTRAQTAEKELGDKIANEVTRAISVEKSIITNLNSEMSRASEKENELYFMFKAHENSTNVIDKVKEMVKAETARATKVESNLESQIQEEVTRAKSNDEKIYSFVSDELLRFKSVEQNFTEKTHEIIRHARELELEVRKTVMAEVARAVDAENSLKLQISAEAERAKLAENTLNMLQVSNHSDCSARIVELTQEVEKDNLRLEDMALQISRNLTGDILTLAELFDDKLDDLERSENVRLKKLEEDMKKCCSTSSWRWRTPGKGKSTPKTSSRAEGVISKIMQVFGALPEESNTKKKQGSKKKPARVREAADYDEEESEGRSISGAIPFVKETIFDIKSSEEVKPDTEPEVVVLPTNTLSSEPRPTVIESGSNKKNETTQIIYGKPVSELDKDKGPPEIGSKTYRNRLMSRASRREKDSGGVYGRFGGVSVQSVNSKVTSTYG